MKRLAATILFFLLAIPLWSQNSVNDELRFIKHLINQGEYGDAIYYIDKKFNGTYILPIRDSLNFYNAYSHYVLKKLDSSASLFLQVSKNSPFFFKSRFFASYNHSHLGNTSLSKNILKNLEVSGSMSALKNFELAGNALLERDYEEFNHYFKSIKDSENFSFNMEKNKLDLYCREVRDYKIKSPLTGAFMSAIIPGAGKIYAGKTGEGISSFLVVVASGLTALENYNKLGLKHAKTIIFGSLFAVLYIGNIYGTVFTVKLTNDEFNQKMDHKILFNMHIPLRNFFN